ncbi:MAG: methionine adenosyltransferase [Coprobacillus sp.]|nr:methionine adenosyltransferase [Coprobacillus sp.]
MEMKTLFTSESVSMGHPDKICDQIADRILDAYLSIDPDSHVAIEVMATNNQVYVSGEVTSKVHIDIRPIVKDTLIDIGYDKDELGTNGYTVEVFDLIKKQSPEINEAVTAKDLEHLGAGDQGIMFGYATSESSTYMPLGISIAHALVRRATNLRKSGAFEWARPDMKAQCTMDYTDLNNIKIHTLLMSIQHNPDTDMRVFTSFVHDNIMVPVAKEFGLNTDFEYLVNPSGSFVLGGPSADTGMSGRKVIVDTYGGSAEHGGGSFSGKDPTKVDRSGAYMARYIAKNLVAAGVATRILVQLSYAIGKPSPISIGIKTYHSARYSDEKILECISSIFDCRVGMIIKQFSLTHPSFWYSDLSNYGHFGRTDIDLPWERLDKVDEIKAFLSK